MGAVARRVGREGEPVVVIDDFHPDPAALRAAAMAARFEPARRHYPGLRAALPPDYFAAVRPALAPVLRQVFGQAAGVELIDASFSLVTTAPAALSPAQRLPHVDAVAPGRLALVHFLAGEALGGTAFYRHRATGFEVVSEARSAAYLARLDAELGAGPAPAGYPGADHPWFEQVAHVAAQPNRAVVYRGALLHSGAIPPDAALSADPAAGRLTVTAFLMGRG